MVSTTPDNIPNLTNTPNPVIACVLGEAISKTANFLIQQQDPKGYWVGKLEADASVSAGYIPLKYFMEGEVDPDEQSKVLNKVKSQQNQDGSWSLFQGGPGDLNVSIQVYFAMRLAGVSQSETNMQQARDFILSKGGIEQANLFVKIWLSLFGQYDWRRIPCIPPEIVFLPDRFIFNIYDFASWSRATIMALIVLLNRKPTCPLPDSAVSNELYSRPVDIKTHQNTKSFLSWDNFFLLADQIFKAWERLPLHPVREIAIRKVEQWIVEHQESDGSWGGIMLPWIFSLMALKSLGYRLDHPVIVCGLEGLYGFMVKDNETLLLQPSVSPIWDTAWAIIALKESGLPADHTALQKAALWLLAKENRHEGDWRVKNPGRLPGGWSFEFENKWYPDLDDSAVVPRALRRVKLSDVDEAAKEQAIGRALDWIAMMQSRDGGWAAFDRDNDKKFLDHVPFASFMSPLDPTCSDVTAHVVELLSDLDKQSPDLRRALSYMRDIQETDGAWYGRWGVNYLYGTGLTLSGLASAGDDSNVACIERGVEWLLSRQNEDGGWGETCETYAQPALRGRGPSTASQTSWALMGLIAAGKALHPAVRKGVQYLLSSQQADGTWREDPFTGTGFPKVFYLRYDLYRVYFPLIALARYRSIVEKNPSK
jgi:squalene-hopene/tetraprenyl-beta-curcumene cyclase